MTLDFAMSQYHRIGDLDALYMAEFTLEKMAHGGIYDQLGGGFHRYSVDAIWLVPHFEKMLYDNAQLLRSLSARLADHTGERFIAKWWKRRSTMCCAK